MLRSSSSTLFSAITRCAAVVSGTITILMVLFVFRESISAIEQIGVARFLSDEMWSPMADLYNITPMFVGTLLASVLAVAAAIPIAVMISLFRRYAAPRWFAVSIRIVMELLAGIPSVVYGFWGLVVLVPYITDFHPPGSSLLAASMILSVMVLPTMMLSCDASLDTVPLEQLNAARALGLSFGGFVRLVLLPNTWSMLFAGSALTWGRAIGETMAVLMVCGNIVQIPHSVFDPIRTLTANIALEMSYAVGVHRSALFVSGLVLVFLISILVIVTNRLKSDELRPAT